MMLDESVWVAATAHLEKMGADIGESPSAPEDVRRLRRLRTFLSRVFHKSRPMKTLSVLEHLDEI